MDGYGQVPVRGQRGQHLPSIGRQIEVLKGAAPPAPGLRSTQRVEMLWGGSHNAKVPIARPRRPEHLYTLGGPQARSGGRSALEHLNLATDAWEVLPALPTDRDL